MLAVAQTIASWSADLVEGRRRVRVFIVSAAALYGGLNAISQIAMSGNGASDVANAVNSAVLVLIVAAISYAMMRVDGAELFPRRLRPASRARRSRRSSRARPIRSWSMR